jgi:quercetin dioxygenase-like cupin family protein
MDDGRVILKKKPLEMGSPSTSSSTPAAHTEHEATPRPSTSAAPLTEHDDTTVIKVNSRYSPKGKHGQKFLASGVKLSMRLWEDEQPGKSKSATQRDYETLGYVIKGRAELQIQGQTIILEPGDSWVVPKGSLHRFKILEPFTAVEATCPPAEVHGRDEL